MKNVLQRRNLTLRVRSLGEKLNRLYENLIGDLLLQFSLILTYFKLSSLITNFLAYTILYLIRSQDRLLSFVVGSVLV